MSKNTTGPVTRKPLDSPPPPDPNPGSGVNSNLAVFLNEVAKPNSNAVELFGSLLGAIADIGGAVSIFSSFVGVFTSVQQVIAFFNPPPDPLLPVENALRTYFNQLFNVLLEQWREQRWIDLNSVTKTAQGNLEQMLAEDFQTPDPSMQIEPCLAALDTLTDTTLIGTGVYFTLPTAYQVSWTDAGDFLEPWYYYDIVDKKWVLADQNLWYDKGYGKQAPEPLDDGSTVFSYTWVLPYCLQSAYRLLAMGRGLFPKDFGIKHSQGLIIYAAFLSNIHQTIVDATVQLLIAPPGPQGWQFADTFYPGVTLDVGLDGSGARTYFGVTFEVAAVERYSGANSLKTKYMQLDQPGYPGDAAVFRKLTLRSLAGAMDVYAAVGLGSLMDAINSLRQVAGAPALPDHPYRNWSVRKAMGMMDIGPAGIIQLLSVSALIRALVSTPPYDLGRDPQQFSLRAALAA